MEKHIYSDMPGDELPQEEDQSQSHGETERQSRRIGLYAAVTAERLKTSRHNPEGIKTILEILDDSLRSRILQIAVGNGMRFFGCMVEVEKNLATILKAAQKILRVEENPEDALPQERASIIGVLEEAGVDITIQ